MRSLAIGATGMLAQQVNVEVIANNIANMTTTGFKRQRAEFQDLLYQNNRRVGTDSASDGSIVPSGIQLGLGVKLAATYRIHDMGNINPTGNELDLAINGDGFFQIELPNGDTAYTRSGVFQRSAEGQIVTVDGYVLNPGITIPEGALDLTISRDGIVQVTLEGQVEPSEIGQIEVATFINPAGLQAIGDNQFLETAASGSPVTGVPGEEGIGYIMQAFVETSNVDVVQEMTNMISAQRAYEMNSKVIKTSDEMMGILSQVT